MYKFLTLEVDDHAYLYICPSSCEKSPGVFYNFKYMSDTANNPNIVSKHTSSVNFNNHGPVYRSPFECIDKFNLLLIKDELREYFLDKIK